MPRSWARIPCYLLLAICCNVAGAAALGSEIRLQTPAGTELELSRFAAVGDTLLLWLPSERGFGEAQPRHAEKLAHYGYEVWIADLHAAYFVEPGRRSLAAFPLDDVVAVIDHAVRSGKKLLLLSSSRGAQLALIAAREWQLRNPGKPRIAGLVLAHPHLYAARPEIGKNANYLPIASLNNLPVFLLEAQYSTKSARLGDLAAQMGAGGAAVYTQMIAGVQGGFFARADSELGELDRQAKRAYAGTLRRAIELLKSTPTPARALASAVDARRLSQPATPALGMVRLAQPLPAPALRLDDFSAGAYRLDARRGRVVLLNFWASWCRPCVEEIPSLHRLHDSIAHPEFEIVTVNVGEDRARIAAFLERVAIELPLLMDLQHRAAADWKVYVYPSSYLVDRDGQIRYAYLGALQWDSTQNIEIIRRLLRQH